MQRGLTSSLMPPGALVAVFLECSQNWNCWILGCTLFLLYHIRGPLNFQSADLLSQLISPRGPCPQLTVLGSLGLLSVPLAHMLPHHETFASAIFSAENTSPTLSLAKTSSFRSAQLFPPQAQPRSTPSSPGPHYIPESPVPLSVVIHFSVAMFHLSVQRLTQSQSTLLSFTSLKGVAAMFVLSLLPYLQHPTPCLAPSRPRTL